MADEGVSRQFCCSIGIADRLPITAYHRYQAHTNEPLDRRQEGWIVLATVRPIGIAFMIALIVYAVNPARMAWAAVPLRRGGSDGRDSAC